MCTFLTLLRGRPSVILFALAAAVAAFSLGCGRGSPRQDPATIIPELERAFGMQFPTNVSNMHAASWKYRARLDGNSENVKSMVRWEMSSAAFAQWRNSVTNFPKEYKAPAMEDPRAENELTWWNIRRIPEERFTYSFYEIKNGLNDYRKLDAYFVNFGSTNLIYVSAHVLTR